MQDMDMTNKSKIYIKNALLPDQTVGDVLISGNKITHVGTAVPESEYQGAEVLDGTDKAVIPGFANTHTHAAMTYFRGYGDDLDLMDWLNNMVWPVEAHLTPEDVYWGSKMACVEMIKSGTTAFLDMYTFPEGTAQAVEESGMRAVLSYTMFDQGNEDRAKLDRENLEKYLNDFRRFSDRVQFSVGPHAIYTVSGKQLKYAHEFAQEHDLLVHLHLSETYVEWKEACRKYGTTPVRYLNNLGILSPRLVLAHSLWMDSEELQMLADNGCSTVHNPASNMKLASGYRFRFDEMRNKGIRLGIGTDGCSSSNTLDMTTAMRLASFLAKAWSGDPKAAPARDVFECATKSGYEILRVNGGEIAVGSVADLCLVDLTVPEMTPVHNLISNMVYSASGSFIDTTIVDGKILMRNRVVEGEKEVREQFLKHCDDLFERSKSKNNNK